MARLTHTVSGVTVETSDETAALLGAEWAVSDGGSTRSASPDDSWTVAELKDHAATNDIDLGGATKKDDILAAINGSGE